MRTPFFRIANLDKYKWTRMLDWYG